MRTLNRNKQKMYYSLQDGTSPVYMTDDDGNIKYIEVDGERIPVESGDTEPHYTEPKLFRANINSTLTDTFIRAFGIDDSSDKATIVCAKGTLPLAKGARIWRNSAIKYKDPTYISLTWMKTPQITLLRMSTMKLCTKIHSCFND